MENKVSFIGGFFLTTMYSMTLYDMAMAGIIGLIGGFFGILGKDVYFWVKKKLWK